MCDWSDWENPLCRAATTAEFTDPNIQKVESCDDMPWCTNQVFQYCDLDAETCKTVYSEDDCLAEPHGWCDPAKPTCDQKECSATSFVWCDTTLGCQSGDEAACEFIQKGG